jgi:hypothetical protein
MEQRCVRQHIKDARQREMTQKQQYGLTLKVMVIKSFSFLVMNKK